VGVGAGLLLGPRINSVRFGFIVIAGGILMWGLR